MRETKERTQDDIYRYGSGEHAIEFTEEIMNILSPKELEVAKLLVDLKTQRKVSDSLNKSQAYVSKVVRSIRKKYSRYKRGDISKDLFKVHDKDKFKKHIHQITDEDFINTLFDHERRIIRLINLGKNTTEIAQAVRLSEEEVNTSVERVEWMYKEFSENKSKNKNKRS